MTCRTRRCSGRVELDGLCSKHLTAELDRLYSLFVRRREPFCTNCGSTEFLECSHHITRARWGSRWHPLGATTHCRGCHVRFTNHEALHVEFVRWYLGEDRYAELLDLAYGPADADGRRAIGHKSEIVDREALLEWLRREEEAA